MSWRKTLAHLPLSGNRFFPSNPKPSTPLLWLWRQPGDWHERRRGCQATNPGLREVAPGFLVGIFPVSTLPPKTPPNPLFEIALTIVLPSLVLEQLSKPERLGPFWALVVSLVFPIAFGLWCWWKRTRWNVFSVLGLVTILLSGGLGLLKLSAFWVGIKETAMPLVIALAFPLSHRFGKPLIHALLMQPHILNVGMIQARLATSAPAKEAFGQAVFRASLGMGAGMALSSVANFFLALYLLKGKEPGSEAFVKGLGTLNWAGMVVIGVPLMAIMVVVFVWLLRQIQRITGLERDDLLNPGRTVRRQVERPEGTQR